MTERNNNRAARHRHSGVGMIEVLIAILVFSMGMLALVGMQLAGKRASFEATQRSIATGLARDIIERMRSNPDQLNAYAISNIGDPNDPLATPDPDCAAANCIPSQLADYDLASWESLLVGAEEQLAGNNAGGLVSPRACISNADGNVTIAIAWRGVISATNPADSNCGNAVIGLYDDADEAEGNNLKRRLLVLSTFIGNS